MCFGIRKIVVTGFLLDTKDNFAEHVKGEFTYKFQTVFFMIGAVLEGWGGGKGAVEASCFKNCVSQVKHIENASLPLEPTNKNNTMKNAKFST